MTVCGVPLEGGDVTFEQVPTGPAGAFLARVQVAAAGTPFRVRATRTGFDVLLDGQRLAHRVQIVDEQDRTFAVTEPRDPAGDGAGRRLVATAAADLGWTERHGTGERVSLTVLLAGGGALLVMIALVVVLLVRLL